jgi:hypothetical protein
MRSKQNIHVYRRRQFIIYSGNKKSLVYCLLAVNGAFFGGGIGGVLLSHAVSRAVPSALKGLTSVFGMETGVSPSLSPPKFVMYHHQNAQLNLNLWLSRTAD